MVFSSPLQQQEFLLRHTPKKRIMNNDPGPIHFKVISYRKEDHKICGFRQPSLLVLYTLALHFGGGLESPRMTKCQADLPQSGHYAVLLLCFPTAEGGRAPKKNFS